MSDAQNMRNGEEGFSTRLGLILSCMGCMVGTGNIWRFPRIVAENSGGEGSLVILVIWALFLVLWSIPMLVIEYGIGRFTGKAVVQSFRQILGDKAIWMGGWVTAIPIIVGFWYSVILGWCFYYTVHMAVAPLPTNETESKKIFDSFVVESYWPVLTHFLAVLIASVAVIKGGKTIERVNLVSVPIFLLLILFTFIWAVSRTHAEHGLRFLFTPHWESLLNPRTFVDALAQNAFDTGAGMGLMLAYSTYMSRQNGAVRYATVIPACNNMISLICGMSIFSIVFSVLKTTRPDITQSEILDVIQDSGPASTGLTFIWLPVLFASIGPMGKYFAVMFFLCLSFAGITSMISYLELAAQTLRDIGVPRYIGVPVCFLAIFFGGLPSALSVVFLTNQDFVWAFSLVISGLIFQSMVIRYGTAKFRTIVINDFGEDDWYLPKLWEWIMKFVAPVEAVTVLLWWAVNLIIKNVQNGIPWYDFGTESIMATLAQWALLLVVMVGINVGVVYYQARQSHVDKTEEKHLELDEDPVNPADYGALERPDMEARGEDGRNR